MERLKNISDTKAVVSLPCIPHSGYDRTGKKLV